MQTRNPFIDDLTKMANGAMGALTGVKDEVEARIRDQIAKILDGMDIAPRRVRRGEGHGRQGARGERGAEEAARRAAGQARRRPVGPDRAHPRDAPSRGGSALRQAAGNFRNSRNFR